MTTEGVDYSFDKPSIAGLAAVGKRFACRYVGKGSTGKRLTQTEARELAEAGLTIVANVEGHANGLLGGRIVGADWARAAHDEAVRCGMAPDRPIYLSVDFDCTPEQWPDVREALDAAGDEIGHDRIGVYGGYDVVRWAKRDNVARWFWQTYAWSEGRWTNHNHIEQYRNGVSLVGGTVDLNRALTGDFGQWTPIGSVPPGEESPVNLDQEDLDAIANAVVTETLGHSGPNVGVALQSTYGTLHNGETEQRLVRIESKLDALEAAGSNDTDNTLDLIVGKLDALESRPAVDPVALAAALLASPDFASAIADAVAARVGTLSGETSLSGTVSLSSRPNSG